MKPCFHRPPHVHLSRSSCYFFDCCAICTEAAAFGALSDQTFNSLVYDDKFDVNRLLRDTALGTVSQTPMVASGVAMRPDSGRRAELGASEIPDVQGDKAIQTSDDGSRSSESVRQKSSIPDFIHLAKDKQKK